MDAKVFIDHVCRDVAALPGKPTEGDVRKILLDRLEHFGLLCIAEEIATEELITPAGTA